MSATLRSRSAMSVAPWEIPNTSCPGAISASRERRAQSEVRRTAAASSAGSTSARVHSSNAIAMSEPRLRCTAIASSGVNRCLLPSYTDLNQTPSSSTRSAVCRSENTWKPPESVRIGPSHAMKLCSPPSSAISSSPGRKCRW